MVREWIGKLHLWLGLASGVVVLIVGITGCLYVFQNEITDLVSADTRFVEVPANPVRAAPSQVFAAARAALPYDGFEHLYYTEYSDPERVISLWAWHDETKVYQSVWIDPYTAEVTETYRFAGGFTEDFFGTVMELHTSLLLGAVGRTIVGVSTLIFVVQLITGLVLWWPRSWRAIRPRLTIQWPGKAKRVNYDLHQVLGFYAGWVLVFIALTGLVWAFGWVDQAVYTIASGGAERTELPDWSETGSGTVPIPEAKATLDRVASRVRQAHPDVHSWMFEEPHDEDEPISVSLQTVEAAYGSRTLFYDGRTAEPLHDQPFSALNRGEQLRRLNWDLHVGTLFGLPTKLLAFFASLVAASLPVTGFLIWYPRFRKARRKAKRTATKPAVEPSADTPQRAAS
ncbi:MAG: PepSY-associated TM helix domain-containing protein [Myxococcota bacterium]